MTFTLRDAYKNLRVDKPLDPMVPEEAKLLEPNIFGNLASMATRLNFTLDTIIKIVLSGHTGCGKSTFLNLLVQDNRVKNCYFPIKFSVREVLNPDDVTQIDLLAAIGIVAIESAEKKGLIFTERFEKEIISLYQLLTGEQVIEQTVSKAREVEGKIEAEAGIGGRIAGWIKLVSKFTAAMKVNRTVREETRTRVTGKIQDLIILINNVLNEIRLAASLPILLLVDDTDKIPYEKALKVFLENGQDLKQLSVTAIFVLNMDVVCSGSFRMILDKLGAVSDPIPPIKFISRSGEADRKSHGFSLLLELLRRRAPSALFESGALEELVELSGGVTREAVRLASEAVIAAATAGSKTVRGDDVKYSMFKLRNEFNLTSDKIRILQETLSDPQWVPSEDLDVDQQESPYLELLGTLGLLQYRNGEDKWFRPHPVLVKYLEDRKR